MSGEEFANWFDNAEEPDLRSVIRSMEPSTEPVAPGPIPMELSSIRLPVDLVIQLDAYAQSHGKNRSTVIREALTAFVAGQNQPVDRDDVVHALEVIRRAVDGHYPHAA
jgi:predicted DNA-binding protein